MKFEALHYQPRPVEDHLHTRLLAMDVVAIDATWHAAGVRSSFWRLYINDRPGAVITTPGRDGHAPVTRALAPDRLHLIPAWAAFDYQNTRRISHFFIHFDIVGWPPALVRDLFPDPLTLPPLSTPIALAQPLIERLRHNQHHHPATVTLAKSLVYLAVSAIIPVAGPRAARWDILQRGPTALAPALHHIESHLFESLSNPALARLCHMSRGHFIRTFRRTVGQTPAQYVRERRVARAAEQLTLTPATIDDVAQRCGFANRYYFTRAFTQVMGVPPAKYRAKVI